MAIYLYWPQPVRKAARIAGCLLKGGHHYELLGIRRSRGPIYLKSDYEVKRCVVCGHYTEIYKSLFSDVYSKIEWFKADD